MRIQRVAVTGCAGFIGSHFVRRILTRPDVTVLGIDNFDPMYNRALKIENVSTFPTDRFRMIEADIVQRSGMAGIFESFRPDLVVHFAALAGVRPSIQNPERYASVNIDGLVSVLDAARAAKCRNVVFASSSSVYGNASRVPFSEEDRADEPISPYAATKRAGELLCHTYSHLFGLRIASLRFFTVFGPAQRPDLAIMMFMSRIARGQSIQMFGDGSSSRDYTYVDDIIDGVLASADMVSEPGAAFHRVFNLGGSQPVTLAEMITAIERVVGKRAVVEQVEMRPGDVERTFADLTRSTSELGYRPRVSFEEGVERQWSWLRRRLESPMVLHNQS